jgi:hypothetical protein
VDFGDATNIAVVGFANVQALVLLSEVRRSD